MQLGLLSTFIRHAYFGGSVGDEKTPSGLVSICLALVGMKLKSPAGNIVTWIILCSTQVHIKFMDGLEHVFSVHPHLVYTRAHILGLLPALIMHIFRAPYGVYSGVNQGHHVRSPCCNLQPARGSQTSQVGDD